MKPRKLGLIALAIWLGLSVVAISYAQGTGRITPEFVSNWLSVQGLVQGADVQLCPHEHCAIYHIERLSIETEGDFIVVRFLPRRR